MKTYEDGLNEAAEVCAKTANNLLSNGRARVNLTDRSTAEMLRIVETKIRALGDEPLVRP